MVIADFENRTNDPAFDRVLEPMLKRALEGAGFITAFDRDGIGASGGSQVPEQLDEMAARTSRSSRGLASCSPARSSRPGEATGSA